MDCTHSQWYPRMKRALDLSAKSPATQESYLRSLRQLVDYLGKKPDDVEEAELERYLLFRRNECRWKPATLRLCYAGVKFYFRTVLDRRWKLFSILRAEDQRTLPVVLTQQEVTRILSEVTTFHNHVFLSLVYACGLRLGEALALTVDDVDARAATAATTAMNRASVRGAFLRARKGQDDAYRIINSVIEEVRHVRSR